MHGLLSRFAEMDQKRWRRDVVESLIILATVIGVTFFQKNGSNKKRSQNLVFGLRILEVGGIDPAEKFDRKNNGVDREF